MLVPLPSFASIAQLVEQRIENPRVPGSIPGRGTIIEALAEMQGLFLFAQRSWQTRQVERNLNHPD